MKKDHNHWLSERSKLFAKYAEGLPKNSSYVQLSFDKPEDSRGDWHLGVTKIQRNIYPNNLIKYCNIALHSFFVVTLSTSSHLRTMSSHGPIQNCYLLNARMSAMVFRLCSIYFPTFST